MKYCWWKKSSSSSDISSGLVKDDRPINHPSRYTGWWFQMFYFLIFTPILGNDPNWSAYFWDGWLNHPSRYIDSKFGRFFSIDSCADFRSHRCVEGLVVDFMIPKSEFFLLEFSLEFFLSPTPERICVFFQDSCIFFKTCDRDQVENVSSGLIFFDLQKPYILAPLEKKLSKDP